MICLGIRIGWNSDSAAFTESVKRKCATCGIWSLAKHEKATCFAGCLKNWRSNARRWAGPYSMCSVRQSKAANSANCLKEAILYGNQPEVRARLKEKVENALDHARLRELIENRSLDHETMDTSRVRQIRETMERANARRLQPYFISSFFRDAFAHLGGRCEKERTNDMRSPMFPQIFAIATDRSALATKCTGNTSESHLTRVSSTSKVNLRQHLFAQAMRCSTPALT